MSTQTLKTNIKSVPLYEAFWFQEGPGVRKWQFTHEGIKLLNVANIEKGGYLNLEKTDRHLATGEVRQRYSHFLLDEGDLVIASSGISFDEDGFLRTRGAFVHKEHLPLCLNTSTIRFKATEGISDLRYLRHWLDSLEFRRQITRLVTGSAQQNFGPSHLRSITISLPPLPEQRRIADILDRAEALRAKRREALALLDQLPQAIFLEMFGDPVTNPMGWEVVEMGELTTRLTVGIVVQPASYYQETGVPALRSLNVRPNRILMENFVFFSATDNETRLAKTRVWEGDLVLVRSGQPGTAAVVPKELNGANSIDILIATPDRQVTEPSYLCAYFNSNGGRAMALGAQRGQIQKHLNVGSLKTAPIPVPPLSLQTEFSKRLNKVEETKQTASLALQDTELLFASLQHRAFRGEL